MPTTLPPFGPAYDPAEALEILRLASAVSTFIPRFNWRTDNKTVVKNCYATLNPHAPATSAPVQSILSPGGTPPILPSLFPHRWPAGWVAGIWQGENPTWARSIVVSEGRTFANQALLAYNPAADAYCLAFRGTMTPGNALEDLAALLVSAGPLSAGDFTLVPALEGKLPALRLPAAVQETLDKITLSKRCYCPMDIPGVTEPLPDAHGLPRIRAHVHAGFRVALESLDFAAMALDQPHGLGERILNTLAHEAHTLTAMLEELGRRAAGRPVKLYVTGHSLGAGMASLCAAWLQTQPIKNTRFQIKLYAFAQPKPGNDYFAHAQSLAFGNGWIYNINNTLDTIPQVGLTLQNLHALNYQGCIAFLAEKLGPVSTAASWAVPPFNYVHMGTEIVLRGAPVVAGRSAAEDGFYNLPPVDPATGQYQFPAYLFIQPTPGMPDDYIPPAATWTVQPCATGLDTATLGMFAPLWQHMPWIYAQALARQLGRI